MTMSLLDAALAFALTMAALATVVTIIMEIIIVAFGLKAKGQVKLVRKLLDEHVEVRFAVTDAYDQWRAVKAILGNRMSTGVFPKEGAEKNRLGMFGRGGGVYNEVSLEHLLRRIVEFDGLDAVSQMPAQLRANLKSVALKYEEWRSAAAVDFARWARFWSLLVGILLAAALNVDGLRLFESYKDNPQMAEKVIEQIAPILEDARKAHEKLEARLEAAVAGVDKPTVESLENAIDGMKAQLGVVWQFGLPIGNAYYPHCLWFKEPGDEGTKVGEGNKRGAGFKAGEDNQDNTKLAAADPLCGSTQVSLREWLSNGVGWFLRVVITGLLMGLGAPFWYDVAKRLGQVRQAFGAKGGAAERHKGAEGDESPEARDKLLDRVVDDALAGARKTRIFIA